MNAPDAPTLRPATRADDAFLLQLYASTRADELAPLGWNRSQREAFLREQFIARRRAYAEAFPGAAHQIVLVRKTPAGALIVHRTAGEIRLVDLALLPTHRNAGFGTRLLRELMNEANAARKPLRLQVLKANRARDLYLRLGFAPSADNSLHLKMEWHPPLPS